VKTCQEPGGEDSGFTLIEVVVAMVIFTVMAGSVLGLLVKITQTTGDNVRRTAASNIASQQIETVRNLNLKYDRLTEPDPLPLGRQPATYQQVGGITYKIVQTNYPATKLTDSVCSSTSGPVVEQRLVRVVVTWPDMGSRKPVTADTLRAIDTFDAASAGNVAVSVTGYDGVLADVPVSLTPTTGSVVGPQSTGDDGCTAFSGFPLGTYIASPDLAGYVGLTNTRFPQQTAAVADSSLVRSTLTYAAARSATVSLGPPAGATPATGIPMRLGSTYIVERTVNPCTGSSTSECTTGWAGTTKYLYPTTYTMKAGACADAAASVASVALTVAPSVVPTVTVPLGAINVRVQTTVLGTPIATRTVTFQHANETAPGCTAGESYTTSSVIGGSTIALPYGTWTVRTTSLLGLPTIQTVTLAPTTPATRTQNVTLLVLT
jgi:prepilin-type N-terminal cleavage/methylation domain-containing protein